jgi:nucleotide-binding universal stress UspA family protein
MKKIIAVFDGTKYSESTSAYSIDLALKTNSLLVGVFIHDMRYLNFTYAYTWDQPFVDVSALDEIQKEDREKIDLNIALFKRACSDRGVRHKIHLDKGVPLQELLKESSFADLVVIDSHTGFFALGNSKPAPFIKDLLADAHCPTLIVPHNYSEFNKTILCYDGSLSSIYAIKMFSYILPEYSKLNATVLSANENNSNHLKSGENFKDLINLHFNNINFEVLTKSNEDDLLEYLKINGENSVIVMGSYSRNAISRLIHQSFSNRVISEINVPVFIAHQ